MYSALCLLSASLTALSIIRLLEKSCKITSGEVVFLKKDLLQLEEKEMRHIDNLTYKTFVNKFNETYKNTLQENQKTLQRSKFTLQL